MQTILAVSQKPDTAARCLWCAGTGKVRARVPDGPDYRAETSPCPVCQGRGVVYPGLPASDRQITPHLTKRTILGTAVLLAIYIAPPLFGLLLCAAGINLLLWGV